MQKPRFLVDVDHVLADFETPAMKAMSKLTGRKCRAEDFTQWNFFETLPKKQLKKMFEWVERKGFCSSLKPLPGAIEAIEELRTHFDVFVVTSPHLSLHWTFERTKWLKRHFGFTKTQIVFTASKYLVRGDCFLDDHPIHVAHWAKENPSGTPMLWHIPNTRTLGLDDLRVYSWEQVIEKATSKLERKSNETVY